MMRIDRYRFGHIEIEGMEYDSDVIVGSERVLDHWWRKQGHNLVAEDLDEVIAQQPEVVVVGSGYYGRMQVPESTRRYLEQQGIRVEVAKTGDAVERFNRLQQDYARIVAALHLTC